MSNLTQFAQDLSALFALVTTLAVLVTGFFLGRHWLSKTGGNSGWNTPEGRAEKAANDAAPPGEKWM